MLDVLRPLRELRTMYTRTGARPIRVNDPDGWMTEPAIPQPGSGGSDNPGFHWVGSDSPSWFTSPTVGGGLPSVYRALGLIVDSIASVPWAVYRGRDRLPEPGWIADPQMAQNDDRAPGAALALARMIPDPLHSVAFRAQLVSSMVMHGEAFLYHPVLDDAGYPLAPVFLLNPVDVGWDKSRKQWKVGQAELAPELVLHVRGRAPYTEDGRGVGVLTRHADTIRMSVNLRNYVSSSLRSGVPAGYLKVSSPAFTQEQADGLKAAWLAAHGGDTRSIAVLNATTDFSPLSWSLADVAAVEMGGFTDREIAHAFGMSAHYLDVAGESGTYANVQDRAIDFRTFTLLHPARLIESAMGSRLPYGTTMKIKLEGLERANITTRDQSYAAGLAGGWRTVDEIRELEDLPPLVEGASDE